MVQEVFRGVYQIGVPLLDSPLKMTNAYLVKSRTRAGRHLLIDNGFNQPEGQAALSAALAGLDLNTENLDFFLTHLHADHSGLTLALRGQGKGKIWCSAGDGRNINRSATTSEYWDSTFRTMARHGASEKDMALLRSNHTTRKYASPGPLDYCPVMEGDVLEYDGYAFRVIAVPGHTPDHLALYELTTRSFFSGDHILGNITPGITHWDDVEDTLGLYLHSLDKVAGLDIARTFPGHRMFVDDTAGRVRELRAHHRRRLDEVRALLAEGPANAWQVASRMTWSRRGKAWTDFPASQKWFAAGETLARLEHLLTLGEAEFLDEEGRFRLRSTKRIFFFAFPQTGDPAPVL